jgi:hypothetical protein
VRTNTLWILMKERTKEQSRKEQGGLIVRRNNCKPVESRTKLRNENCKSEINCNCKFAMLYSLQARLVERHRTIHSRQWKEHTCQILLSPCQLVLACLEYRSMCAGWLPFWTPDTMRHHNHEEMGLQASLL